MLVTLRLNYETYKWCKIVCKLVLFSNNLIIPIYILSCTIFKFLRIIGQIFAFDKRVPLLNHSFRLNP